MPLQLYDTWQRELRPFTPIHADHVGLYCCGPTVYDYAHIGNLRTYVFEDLLRRVLEFNGFTVRHVVNITDVGHLVSDADEGEDKMEKGSRRTGESARAIAERYTAAFFADMRALNLLEPTQWCRASEHLPEQIGFIAELERRGYTYRTADGIYFDTSRQDDYGYLARLQRSGLQPGIRVEQGEKRHACDFALWKFSPSGVRRQMEWDSPWGVGFPGWHIECSAMATRYLSPWFDIHCGGEDHIAVHHCNEIAQSQACHDTRLANFWLHGAFLRIGDDKMSKSGGDFLRLQTLTERNIEPLAYRYLCLTAHYRRQLSFDWKALAGAQHALDRLRALRHGWPEGGDVDRDWLDTFRTEVNDDLNLPRALAQVWGLAKSTLAPDRKRATLDAFDAVLGLGLAHWQPRHGALPPPIAALAAAREEARRQRRWAEADALRAEIVAQGYGVEDGPQGVRIVPRR